MDLEQLVDLCSSVDSWLRADVNNVVVIHCTVSLQCFLIRRVVGNVESRDLMFNC